MKLTMLGTGHAIVTECYNTCFVLSEGGDHLLVDGGGGIGLLRQLKKAGIPERDIHDVFVTHRHLDHILGILWLLRLYSRKRPDNAAAGKQLRIYANDETLSILCRVTEALFSGEEADAIRDQVSFVPVADGQSIPLLGRSAVFFDVHSLTSKQFGFSLMEDGLPWITCCGDESYHESERPYVQDCEWLLLEAFRYRAKDGQPPLPGKRRASVREACEIAQRLGVRNLVLYHTEDRYGPDRKSMFLREGQPYFSGRLFVPDDLDVIEISAPQG